MLIGHQARCPAVVVHGIVVLFVLVWAVVGDGRLRADDSSETITSFSQLARHYGRTDVESVPLVVDGLINYWDRRDDAVFASDGHDAVYLDVTSADFENHPRLAPGTRVLIKGHLIIDGHFVHVDSLDVFTEIVPIDPQSVRIEDLTLGDWWSHRVTTTGVVREVAHFGNTWLAAVASADATFRLHRFEDDRPYDWPNLIGREIRTEGTLCCDKGRDGNPFRYTVRMNEFDPPIGPTARDATTETDSSDDYVVTSIRALRAGDGALRAGDGAGEQRFQVDGQITSVAEHEGFLIEADGPGIYVQSHLASESWPGHLVTLKLLRDQGNQFRAVSLHSKALQKVQPPPRQNGSAVEVAMLPYRASIEADFVSLRHQGNTRILTLRDGETEFATIWEGETWPHASLENARRVSVTGMLVPSPPGLDEQLWDSSLQFAVELEGDESLQVLSRWWQFSPSLAISLLTIISTVCTVGMICFATLWLRLQSTVHAKRRLEFQLVESQKMDALGRLAGGVAHDFNNLLAGIASNLELIDLRDNQNNGHHDPCIASARRCTAKATRLVRSLLGFSRQTNLDLEVGDINEVVEEAVLLAKTSLSPDIAITLQLSPDVPPCRFDHGQLEQVVLNLLLNARDALCDQTGAIDLRTDRHLDEEGNPCARVIVRDEGIGMDRATSSRVFEPFFTTKRVGEGTGLGLSLAYGIVKQHGGTIQCQSECGVGTAFTITLPAVQKDGTRWENTQRDLANGPAISDPASGVPPSRSSAQLDRRQRGNETEESETDASVNPTALNVLLVDDDDEVRRVSRLSLEAIGHDVTDVSSGPDAIEKIKRGLQVDVVLLDLVMPLMSGTETFCQLKSLRPDLPIVVCSGLLIEIEKLRQASGREPDASLSKPFQLADLARALRQACGGQIGLASESRQSSPSPRRVTSS